MSTLEAELATSGLDIPISSVAQKVKPWVLASSCWMPELNTSEADPKRPWP